MNTLIRLAGVALCGLGLAFSGATGASAQTADWTSGWSGQVTLYGWLPTIEGEQKGPSGEPIVDVTGEDVLEALDMAFMGNAQFQKDRFGLFLDAVYADLSTDGSLAGGPLTIGVETKLGIYTAAATFRLHESDRGYVDVYGGARYFDTRVEFKLDTANLGRNVSESFGWTDGIVGVKGSLPLGERWSVSGFADVGGFDARSDLSWQVYGGANYGFTDRWFGTIGYRYISITKAQERATLDINVYGPLVGITYRF